MLAALLLFLASLAIAIGVLYHFSKTSQLYQTFFVYEKSIEVSGSKIPTIAPFSIIPTLVGVGLGLWWGALDERFRHLQPYTSMSRGPTPFSRGAGVSYQSSRWIMAAGKAAVNKHWLLCLVTLGTFLSQICKASPPTD